MEPNRRRTGVAVVLALGVWTLVAWVIQPSCFATSDFYAFWAAAKLADQRIYDADAVGELQHRECPEVGAKRFIRPAIQALILYPLGRLPFRIAYGVWFLLNVAACLALLRLRGSRPAETVATALYLPLIWSFGLGQDAPLLLLAFVAGTRLLNRGRTCTGGALLAACLLKPNIFFAVPLLLATRKQFRPLVTMCAVAGLLACAATLGAGLDWPVRFVRAALANEAQISPNIVGLPGLIPAAGPGLWLRAVLAGFAIPVIILGTRKLGLEPALNAASAAGLVFAPRAMIYDGVFLLPVLWSRFGGPETVVAGLVLALVVTPLRPLVQL
ncbi:MAG: DUF2029 domain-containing protein, partial [Bryobacteraceae bacterium]|nr:DUF2029 domain-containing protein [Bryobacteraceae bacterium]